MWNRNRKFLKKNAKQIARVDVYSYFCARKNIRGIYKCWRRKIRVFKQPPSRCSLMFIEIFDSPDYIIIIVRTTHMNIQLSRGNYHAMICHLFLNKTEIPNIQKIILRLSLFSYASRFYLRGCLGYLKTGSLTRREGMFES